MRRQPGRAVDELDAIDVVVAQLRPQLERQPLRVPARAGIDGEQEPAR
jgi:hypothetical protein